MEKTQADANGSEAIQTGLFKENSLNFLQGMITGAVAGAADVLINHFLWLIKNQIQSQHKLAFNPNLGYRGTLPNAISTIAITGIQVGLDVGLQARLMKNNDNLSPSYRLVINFLAGLSSAIFSCPTEIIMTKQYRDGISFYRAGKQLMQEGGLRRLYTGLMATGYRDGFFTLFFLGATPAIKEKIEPYCSNDYAASLAAGIVSGIGATISSHAFDTIKNAEQISPISKNFSEAAKDIYVSSKGYGFFKGIIPRGGRLISAVTIMGLVNEKMAECFSDSDEASFKKP